MGGAATGARIRCCEELPGDGPEGGLVNGEAGCHCGFIGGIEGSVDAYAWGVFGVDWYVKLSSAHIGWLPGVSSQSVRLVIVLIAAEILVAAVNILVDLYAGVD